VGVADCGNFTAAAERLGMSKSKASKCVGRLERRLGAWLLQRTTRRLRLTEAGDTLCRTSRTELASMEVAQASVSAQQQQPRSVLRISASFSIGAAQLPPVMREPSRQYRDLQFELMLHDEATALISSGVDVAIRIAEQMPDSSAVFRRVGPQRRVNCV
jgi:DNA-binding transcriptional LysR family regulator